MLILLQLELFSMKGAAEKLTFYVFVPNESLLSSAMRINPTLPLLLLPHTHASRFM